MKGRRALAGILLVVIGVVLAESFFFGRPDPAIVFELRGLPEVARVEFTGPSDTKLTVLHVREWHRVDPDEQVQALVRLIFDQFDRQSSLHAVLRYLVCHGLRIPVRPHCGPNKGQLEWRRPNRVTLRNMIRHPIYAGAYRYGHRQVDPRLKQPGKPDSGRRAHAPEDCLVLLRDRVPAYITWERFQANQDHLKANRARRESLGAPRNGAALLGGLIHCGRCGQRMTIHYSARTRPAYHCARMCCTYGEPMCQSLSGIAVDKLVGEQILVAMAPAALEASLAAVTQIEQERAELARQWHLRRERAQYEADRASRQYQACEPENRLVGRELERRWEEALKQRHRIEDEYERWQKSAPGCLTTEDEQAIRSLAADLPAIWNAKTTTPADRQRIARLLLERVVVTVDKSSEKVDVQLHWIGGQVRSHVVSRPVSSYNCRSDYPKLVQRLREMSREHLYAAEIARRLNAERFHPPRKAKRYSIGMVLRLMAQLGFPRQRRYGTAVGLGSNEYRPMGLARRLKTSRERVRRWERNGWLTSRKDEDGHHVIWADADELRRLRKLGRCLEAKETGPRLKKLKKPKWRPGTRSAATVNQRMGGG